MSLEDVKDLLETTGLSVAYDFFPEEDFPGYPFIVYREERTENMSADGIVYEVIRKIRVELYTRQKDTVSEGKVETALSSVFWNKEETYIDGEKCYQIGFDLTI